MAITGGERERKELMSLEGVAAVGMLILAIPSAVCSIMKIKRMWARSKDSALPANGQPSPPKITKAFLFSTGMIHVGALLGFSTFFVLLPVCLMATVPQVGFGRPLPMWAACLVGTPISGFLAGWIILDFISIYGYWGLREGQRVLDSRDPSKIAAIAAIVGAAIPWCVFFMPS